MIRTLLLGIIFLGATWVGNGQNIQAGNSLIKARYLVSEKLYTEAMTVLENSQISGADPARMALAMGQTLSGLGRFGESNKWLLQVTGEGAADAFYGLAKNYLALDDIPAALQYLGKHLADKNHYPEKQIRLDPAFSRLENNRDWIHLWQTEWYSLLEQQMAECEYLIFKGNLDDASALAHQELAGNPNEPHFLFLLAKIYFMQKDDRLFRQSLDKAWQFVSDDLLLKSRILQVALEANYYEKANIIASELIRQDPSNPEYLITRSLVRILDGKQTLALKEIEATEDAGIAPAELYYQAGRKFSTSMPQQAELYLTKAIETGKMDARFYYERGKVRMGADKIDQALGDWAMSLDINPVQPELYFERAQIRLDQGDSEGACYDWKKALELGNAKATDQLYKYCRLP